jgi:hypothetical protein
MNKVWEIFEILSRASREDFPVSMRVGYFPGYALGYK